MRRAWTPADDAAMRARYRNEPTATLAAALGRSERAVYMRAEALGLRKSAEYLSSPLSGRLRPGTNIGGSTKFQRGLTPWNKGTHWTAGGRSAETRFRPGVRLGVAAAKYKPIGSERISDEGYLQRKINEDLPFQRRWRAVHVLVWEAANGPVPPDHVVVFRDRNKRNFALANLELISRAENMRRNTYHRYGKEIASAIQLRGVLSRQINKRANHA